MAGIVIEAPTRDAPLWQVRVTGVTEGNPSRITGYGVLIAAHMRRAEALTYAIRVLTGMIVEISRESISTRTLFPERQALLISPPRLIDIEDR